MKKIKKNILIIGAGSAGRLVLQEIKNYPDLEYNIEGFVDDDIKKLNKIISNVPVLGTISEITKIVSKKKINQINKWIIDR